MIADLKSILFILKDEKKLSVAQPLLTEAGLHWEYLSVYPLEEFDREVFLSENPKKNIVVLNITSLETSETIITTSSLHFYLSDLKKNTRSVIVSANEYINSQGNIIADLAEPEINNVLREVFQNKNKTVSICLLNSIFNPLHEKNLKNILEVAGYKVSISKDCFLNRVHD